VEGERLGDTIKAVVRQAIETFFRQHLKANHVAVRGRWHTPLVTDLHKTPHHVFVRASETSAGGVAGINVLYSKAAGRNTVFFGQEAIVLARVVEDAPREALFDALMAGQVKAVLCIVERYAGPAVLIGD
jgi:hypothetical protein